MEGQKSPEGNRVMSKVRRSVAAFLLATVVATGMVLVPARANASDVAEFCASVAESIKTLESQPFSITREIMLAGLRSTYAVYCQL
jgi:hypothetical protein